MQSKDDAVMQLVNFRPFDLDQTVQMSFQNIINLNCVILTRKF
jgi:hypothetical protein